MSYSSAFPLQVTRPVSAFRVTSVTFVLFEDFLLLEELPDELPDFFELVEDETLTESLSVVSTYAELPASSDTSSLMVICELETLSNSSISEFV